jgi:hypothetical protein
MKALMFGLLLLAGLSSFAPEAAGCEKGHASRTIERRREAVSQTL